MSEKSNLRSTYLGWFLFGFLVFFAWAASPLIYILHGILFVLTPLVVVVGTLFVRRPGTRLKKNQTPSDKIIFGFTMIGALLGALIGIGIRAAMGGYA